MLGATGREPVGNDAAERQLTWLRGQRQAGKLTPLREATAQDFAVVDRRQF